MPAMTMRVAAALFLPWAVTGWQMTHVVSIQARVQGDKPVWDPSHRAFVSHLGSTFEERHAAMLDSVNLASVEGVLKYVQSEGINQNVLNPAACQRKNNMQYIVFYEVTIAQPAASLAVYQGDPNLVPEYGPFVAMDAGTCTSVAADAVVRPDDCIRMFGSPTMPAVGPYVGAGARSADPRAPYPNTIWFSYPNSCVMQPWGQKSTKCRNEFPGGLCPFGVAPNGVNCTFAYTILGYLRLDDLVGITSLTHSQTGQLYSSYYEFCHDKQGVYKGIEFKAPEGVYDNNAVTSLPFWSQPFDAQANQKRAQAVVDVYNARVGKRGGEPMRPLPALDALRNPPCYVNAKQCTEAPFGCKRDLLAQVCHVCGGQQGGCLKPPPDYRFPVLTAPTLPPAVIVAPSAFSAATADVEPPRLVALSAGGRLADLAWMDLVVVGGLVMAGAMWP